MGWWISIEPWNAICRPLSIDAALQPSRIDRQLAAPSTLSRVGFFLAVSCRAALIANAIGSLYYLWCLLSPAQLGFFRSAQGTRRAASSRGTPPKSTLSCVRSAGQSSRGAVRNARGGLGWMPTVATFWFAQNWCCPTRWHLGVPRKVVVANGALLFFCFGLWGIVVWVRVCRR